MQYLHNYIQNIDQNNFRNSFITLIIEYGVYIPLFVILYYFENKNKYLDNLTNKRNYTLIKKDIIKLLTAFSISEVVFSVSKIAIHYQLLQISVEPYKASMLGSNMCVDYIFCSNKL